MSNKVWFGTALNLKEVKAPAVGTPLSAKGWADSGTDLLGGGYAKISPSTHKEYEFSWGASPSKDVYDILDFRYGVGGLLYYLDPFAMRTNILPAVFSRPFLMSDSYLLGPYDTVADSASFGANFSPAALYSQSTTSKVISLPVPTGYDLFLSVYQLTASIGALEYRVSGPSSFTKVTETLFPSTSTSWTKIAGSSLPTSPLSIDLRWNIPKDFAISGASALLLPKGVTPPPDYKFSLGRGTSGLRFKEEPQITGLSAVYGDEGGLVSATATFIETGLWEQ